MATICVSCGLTTDENGRLKVDASDPADAGFSTFCEEGPTRHVYCTPDGLRISDDGMHDIDYRFDSEEFFRANVAHNSITFDATAANNVVQDVFRVNAGLTLSNPSDCCPIDWTIFGGARNRMLHAADFCGVVPTLPDPGVSAAAGLTMFWQMHGQGFGNGADWTYQSSTFIVEYDPARYPGCGIGYSYNEGGRDTQQGRYIQEAAGTTRVIDLILRASPTAANNGSPANVQALWDWFIAPAQTVASTHNLVAIGLVGCGEHPDGGLR